MTLDPLLSAAPAIQIHAACAILAIALTIAIFTARRGTRLHRVMGRIWVAALALVALSSFWITELRTWGPFSPIHLLSVYTLVQLYIAVWAARTGNIERHRASMKGIAFGALVIAGALTLIPGRTMYRVLLGG